jgi:hypothetical protein
VAERFLSPTFSLPLPLILPQRVNVIRNDHYSEFLNHTFLLLRPNKSYWANLKTSKFPNRPPKNTELSRQSARLGASFLGGACWCLRLGRDSSRALFLPSRISQPQGQEILQKIAPMTACTSFTSTPASRSVLMATALLVACVSSHGQVLAPKKNKLPSSFLVIKDILGYDHPVYDANGDGWDDLWRNTYKTLKTRDKTTDTDGDGLSDYQEMLMWRNPFTKGPIPRPPTAEEIEKAKQNTEKQKVKDAAAWEKRLADATPQLRQLMPPGQSEPDAKIAADAATTAKLRQDAEKSKLLTPSKERALDDLAKKYGVKKEYRDENGKKTLLSGEFMGPVYIQSQDTLSAAGISADQLWPVTPTFPWIYNTSTSGYNLTGAGQTLGMWEVDGGVRTSHSEFGATRVIQKDNATLDATSHASNVAGTMAASGVLTQLGSFLEGRGVAYQASVFAYEMQTNFKTERENAAAGNVTDPPVRLANHSWGNTCGWEREDIDTTAAVNMQWVWYGPPASTFMEDIKFGLYLPNQPGEAGCTQIDLFLQTQAPQHLMVYSCGNDRGEGPGTSPGTYYTRSGNVYTLVNATTVPRDWDDGDASFYDTVCAPGTAKNVLTVGSCEDVFQNLNPNIVTGFGPGSVVTPSSFSGVGPTDDGRIKPDLVAVGSPGLAIRQRLGLMAGSPSNPFITAPSASGDLSFNRFIQGTSFSAPAVTGALGLVMQRRAQLYPTLPAAQAWRGSTLKAIAINTCDDVGPEGPDYRMGYGLMNALKAALAVDDDFREGRGSLIKEYTLTPNQTVSWVVISDGTRPLAVTTPWTDPPGPALTTLTAADPQNAMLVNNIDLKVEYLGADITVQQAPSTVVSTFLPWVLNPDLTTKSATTRALAATRGVDNRNNVEKVSIATPAAGRYRITVKHSGGISGNPAPSNQLVSTVISGVTPELPTVQSLVKSPSGTQAILTFTADPGAYFTIQSSLDLTTWADVGTVLADQVSNAVVVETNPGDAKRFWRMRRGL